MRHRHAITLLLAGSVLAGACSDSNNGDTVTGEGSIRALHAISNLGPVDFLIEETLLGRVEFQGATGIAEYDDLEYEFRFEILLPEDDIDEPTELASRTLSVASDQEYTFVLSGTLDNPQLFLWQQFGRDWAEEIEDAEDNDTEVTVMEVSFGHISTVLGAVDVYLEEPGTSPTASTPRASLSFSEFNPAVELTAGDYQLVVTPAGNPDTLLFASNPLTLSAANSTLITLIDDGGFTTADFAVNVLGSNTGSSLADIDVSAAISAVHAALGTGPVDVFDSSDFSNPLIEDLSFGMISPEIEFAEENLEFVATPANDLGVFLTQDNINIFDGTYNRLFFVGLPGDIQAVARRYDRSTVATHARFQLFNAAVRFSSIDIYVVDLDTDIQLIGPSYSSVLFATGFDYALREADSYNIYVTEPGTNNVIAGPLRVDMAESENYSLIVVDSANLSAVDLLFFQESASPLEAALAKP